MRNSLNFQDLIIRHKLVILCCLLFTVCSLLFTVGCKKKEVKAPEERRINVRVQPAEKKALMPFIETIGTLNPNEEVVVSAEVDGILKDVKADEGTAVSKDMILAILDDADYTLEVKRAEADLRQAEANLSNIKVEYQRKEALLKEELITKQQFDDVSTRLSFAEAEVERIKASLSLAKQKMAKTRISAPLSGVVKEKKVSAGNYVKNGTALFTVIQTKPLKLTFTVSEKDVGKLKTGQGVSLKVDALPEKEFKGKVNIIYPSLEERTRTLQVEAVVPNTDGMLKPGLFAHVRLYTGTEKDTILVPTISLLYEGEIVKVFVVEGDHAQERIIKSGQKHGEMIEITEGLREREQVVVVGQQNLSEGIKVNVSNKQ